MGLKEDMESDAPRPQPTATVKKAAPQQDVLLEHRHGDGRCEEAWIDEEGRRRVRPAIGRIPKYVFNCKACQAEDAKRMALPASTIDPEHTVFMVPERDADQKIIRAYLEKRYPGQELFTTTWIRPQRLALRKGSSIVVMIRRPVAGRQFLGDLTRYVLNKKDELIPQPVDPVDFIDEVVEGAPVNVDDCVSSRSATLLEDASSDLRELFARLNEHAQPTCFIAQYQRQVGSDEVAYSLRPL